MSGANESNLPAIKRNVVNVVSDLSLFDSPVASEFEEIGFEEKTGLGLRVPPARVRPENERYTIEGVSRLDGEEPSQIPKNERYTICS